MKIFINNKIIYIKCHIVLLAGSLLLIWQIPYAQVVSLHGAYISTGSGTVVKLDTLRINNTSTVDNAGTHTLASIINDGTVQGNGTYNISNLFTNTGTFTANNSTVHFNGNINQGIPGLIFNNLNLSGSSTTKTLEAAITAKDLNISSGATLDVSASNYTVGLSGNWTNDGTFASQSGNVAFNGSSAQTLGGAVSTAFNNLTINNNSGVSLTKSQSVSGSLNFTSGLVTTTAANLLTFDAGSSISGAGTGKYINGPVRKNGNTLFTYPVGKSGIYAPISISAPGNSSDAFTAEYQRISPKTLSPTITAPGVAQISNCEYWQLDRTAGTSNVNVTLSWSSASPCNAASYITDLATLTVVHYNGTSWDSHGNDGGTTGNVSNGTVTWNNVSTFSPFTLGSTSALTNPLPVKFSMIRATEKNNAIQIDWSVLTEINVSHYEIQRSSNGQQFLTAGQKSATGNAGDKVSYTWMDMNPGNNVIYYRIKAMDFDGKITYSSIIRVNRNKTSTNLTLYPNPVIDKMLTFGTGNLASGQYKLAVYDLNGQTIFLHRFNHLGGSISQSVQLPAGIIAGTYHLQISGTSFNTIKTFVVQ